MALLHEIWAPDSETLKSDHYNGKILTDRQKFSGEVKHIWRASEKTACENTFPTKSYPVCTGFVWGENHPQGNYWEVVDVCGLILMRNGVI